MQSFIMLLSAFAMDDNIVTDVQCSPHTLNDSMNGLLKYFCCGRDAKVETFISPESNMGCEGCDVSGFGQKFELMVPLVKVQFGKYS